MVEIMKNNFLIIAVCLVFLFLGCFSANVKASDSDIAKQYAPILHFERNEVCFPVDVSYHIENSYLYQVGSDQPVDMNPSADELLNHDISIRNMISFYSDELLGLKKGQIIIDTVPQGIRKRLIEGGVLRKFGSKYEITESGLKNLLTQC